MSHSLFAFPTGPHVDPWLWVLVGATAIAGGVAAVWEWQLRFWWRHHPFRTNVEGHIAGAAVAAAVLLAVTAAAHGLGWQVWGAPILGGIGLALLLLVVVFRRVAFLPQLRRYEVNAPELTTPRADLPPVHHDRMEFPLIVALAAAPAAYLSFGWHTWPHAYHMGMNLLGFLIAFAVASLVAAQLEDVARFHRAVRRGSRARGRR